jgi:hypothetical protein
MPYCSECLAMHDKMKLTKGHTVVPMAPPAEPAPTCPNCDNASSTHHCAECSEYYCGKCLAMHDKMKLTKGHTVVPLPGAEGGGFLAIAFGGKVEGVEGAVQSDTGAISVVTAIAGEEAATTMPGEDRETPVATRGLPATPAERQAQPTNSDEWGTLLEYTEDLLRYLGIPLGNSMDPECDSTLKLDNACFISFAANW